MSFVRGSNVEPVSACSIYNRCLKLIHNCFLLFFLGGSDFIAKRVPRSFSLNGTQEVCECITILPDSLAEGDEFFDIAIFFDDARIISSRSRVRIKDDDGKKKFNSNRKTVLASVFLCCSLLSFFLFFRGDDIT